MIDALGSPQSVLVLGGTSDIALATVERWATRGGLRVVLAARPSAGRADAAERLEAAGCDVEVLDFDARDTATHEAVMAAARASGDIDVALVAFGVLGDAEQAWQDHGAAVELAEVNYVGAVSCGGVQNTVSRSAVPPSGSVAGAQCAVAARRPNGSALSGLPFAHTRPAENSISWAGTLSWPAAARASLSRSRSAAICTAPPTAGAKRLA